MLHLFDCDGVLIDSEVIAGEIDAELLAEAGYEITPEEVHHRFAGMTMVNIKAAVEEETGRSLPDDFLARHRAEMDRRIGEEVDPIDGVHDMLDVLQGERCVCSNSSPERLRISMGRAQLYSRFEPHIFSAVAVGTKKPKPDPNVYAYAVAHFGVDTAQAVALDDSVTGVAAAKAAGLKVIGFTGGGHTWPGHADMLTDAGADTVIRRFADYPATAAALMSWQAG